jgi:uncharacterized membrane protein
VVRRLGRQWGRVLERRLVLRGRRLLLGRRIFRGRRLFRRGRRLGELVMSFFDELDNERIVKAIVEAERASSAEIRVHVTRRRPADLEAQAKRRFERLGMTRTAARNGVLIYVAPNIRRFEILGDTAIHEKAGQSFWDAVAGEMEALFREHKFNDAIVRGVTRAGEELAKHFPRGHADVDELSNVVDEEHEE